jgi:hypothetical protein
MFTFAAVNEQPARKFHQRHKEEILKSLMLLDMNDPNLI